MKFELIEDFKKLKGGIDILSLEKIISDLLIFLRRNKLNWFEGIELINDLIYLKRHDSSRLSKAISEQIFTWIEEKYDSEKILDTVRFEVEENSEEEKIVRLIDLTLNTIYHLNQNIQVLPFIQEKRRVAKTDFEKYELQEAIEYLKIRRQISVPKKVLSEAIKDEILKRTDDHFQTQFDEKRYNDLYSGFRETISEHKESYSIFWGLKSEKYTSTIKKTLLVGVGALFLSKTTDLIEMSGSGPHNWEEWFELEIFQQETYWVLEIHFDKRKISILKVLFSCSTRDILNMVDDNGKIIIEEEEEEITYLKEKLDEYKVINTLEKRRRSKMSTD